MSEDDSILERAMEIYNAHKDPIDYYADQADDKAVAEVYKAGFAAGQKEKTDE